MECDCQVCPISCARSRHPTLCNDGYTYKEEDFRHWSKQYELKTVLNLPIL